MTFSDWLESQTLVDGNVPLSTLSFYPDNRQEIWKFKVNNETETILENCRKGQIKAGVAQKCTVSRTQFKSLIRSYCAEEFGSVFTSFSPAHL